MECFSHPLWCRHIFVENDFVCLSYTIQIPSFLGTTKRFRFIDRKNFVAKILDKSKGTILVELVGPLPTRQVHNHTIISKGKERLVQMQSLVISLIESAFSTPKYLKNTCLGLVGHQISALYFRTEFSIIYNNGSMDLVGG